MEEKGIKEAPAKVEAHVSELVVLNGKSYLRSEYTVDFGEKNGCCRVEVLAPYLRRRLHRAYRMGKVM